MGVYLRLLARYLRLHSTDLSHSAKDADIKIVDNAQPAFADK
jgi:hypothetical protein